MLVEATAAAAAAAAKCIMVLEDAADEAVEVNDGNFEVVANGGDDVVVETLLGLDLPFDAAFLSLLVMSIAVSAKFISANIYFRSLPFNASRRVG